MNIEYIGKTSGTGYSDGYYRRAGFEEIKAVRLLGGRHGFEVGGFASAEGMIDLISDDPTAVEARSKIDFKILPLISS